MITREGERLLLSGSIGFDNAVEWREAVLAQIDRDGLVLDLQGVEEADSCALSLLLEWQREARARGFRIAYANLPAGVQSLATVYGVTELIPTVAGGLQPS